MPMEKDIDEPVSEKKSKSSANASSQKSKDLSHVPCKFFKVGSCTAGSACPFAHNAEPGSQKDVCAWYIKGNCKFGHKCALAHVLPGQAMSMDRKNKKAAQLANNSTSSGSKDRERSKPSKKDGRADGSRSTTAGNSLLGGGATAPTRQLSRGPSALSKASLSSPSAPAPPITIKGTEFVQALVDDIPEEELKQNRKEPSSEHPTPHRETKQLESTPRPPPSIPKPVSGPQPQSTPPRTREHLTSPFLQSPGQGSTSPSRVNGFSPGTSPSSHNPLGNGILSTSPFSLPTQAVFISSTYAGEAGLLSSRAGAPSTSLGAGKWGEPGTSPGGQQGYTSVNAEYDSTYSYPNQRLVVDDRSTRDDEGAEDFVPSSLTDLLTPEEMKRRMTKGTKGSMHPTKASEGEDTIRKGLSALNVTPGSQGGGGGHRYSRSVPSPSFLGDIRNIWADPNVSSSPSGFNPSGLPASPSRLTNGFNPVPTNGPPDSAGAGSATSFGNHLSPSNASAAFLSSAFHQQYAKSRQVSSNNNIGRNPIGAGQHRPTGLEFANPTPFSNAPTSHNMNHGVQTSATDFFPPHRASAGNINLAYNSQHTDLNNMGIGDSGILSPGSKALQNHAPGQSLPQGLAAGYSRIHALPPPLPLNSPNASRGLSSSNGGGNYLPGSSPLSTSFSGPGDWGSREGGPGTTPTQGSTPLDQMLSKLSYSQAARVPSGQGNMNTSGVSPFMPPQVVSRNTSGRGPHGVGSPLAAQPGSGDDDLFSMDDS